LKLITVSARETDAFRSRPTTVRCSFSAMVLDSWREARESRRKRRRCGRRGRLPDDLEEMPPYVQNTKKSILERCKVYRGKPQILRNEKRTKKRMRKKRFEDLHPKVRLSIESQSSTTSK
jgi:hypothetical protein